MHARLFYLFAHCEKMALLFVLRFLKSSIIASSMNWIRIPNSNEGSFFETVSYFVCDLIKKIKFSPKGKVKQKITVQ